MEDTILKDLTVVKRSGQRVSFNGFKIAVAIKRAFESITEDYNEKDINLIYEKVLNDIRKNYSDRKTINVEDIQDLIEKYLQEEKYIDIYNSFNTYRLKRAASREAFQAKEQHKFVKAIEKIGYSASQNNLRPNEMINNFARTISKEFSVSYLIENKVLRALEEGTIYLNDLRSYALANTASAHLNIEKIDANNLSEYFDKIITLIIGCKQDQYKEHTIMNFDTNISKILIKEYQKILEKNIINNLEIIGLKEYINLEEIKLKIKEIKSIENNNLDNLIKNKVIENIINVSKDNALKAINNLLKENFVKLFNILETIIKSKNRKLVLCFNNNNFLENNIIIETYLKTLKVSDKIITNIFINDNEEINNLIIDNIKNKKEIHFIFEENKEINYFSDGTKVYENINDLIQTSKGRTINSSATINLVRIALKNKSIKDFYEELEKVMDLTKNALLQRYDLQANKYKENYNKIFESGILFDSEKLENNQKVRKVIRNGAFSIEYSGLVETICLLNNKENSKLEEKDYKLLFEIIKYMKDKCDKLTKDNKLNFILSENYDKETSETLIKIDKSVFGLKKIINKEKYEPVYEFINKSKITLDEKLVYFSKYQSLSGTIAKIKIKDTNNNQLLKIIKSLKEKNIKYACIKIENDN